MIFLYCALVASAFAGYANPPNIAPAMAAYGSSYVTPFNPYPMNSYAAPPPAYSTAPIIPPFGITPAFAGPGAYNTGYPTASLGAYSPPPPPPFFGGYGGYRNSYQTGYNNYNPGYGGSPFASGPVIGNGPVLPSGGPILPSGGPILPSGGPILPNGPVFPSGGPVSPAGVLPASFNNDPWSALSPPMLRGAPTKQVNTSSATNDELTEESKRKARH